MTAFVLAQAQSCSVGSMKALVSSLRSLLRFLAVEVVRGKFGLARLTLVGDRGMITAARIEALKGLGGLSWITCLRAPAIAKLAAADGPLQPSLFDTQDLAEIDHPDYPGERLITPTTPVNG